MNVLRRALSRRREILRADTLELRLRHLRRLNGRQLVHEALIGRVVERMKLAGTGVGDMMEVIGS